MGGHVEDPDEAAAGGDEQVTLSDGTVASIPKDPARLQSVKQARRNAAVAALPTTAQSAGVETGAPANIYDDTSAVLDPGKVSVGVYSNSGLAVNGVGGGHPHYFEPDSPMTMGSGDIEMHDIPRASVSTRSHTEDDPATDSDGDVSVSLGQTEVAGGDKTSRTTSAKEKKAWTRGQKIALVLGLASVVSVTTGLLIWIFGFGGKKLIDDHFAPKPDPTAPIVAAKIAAMADRTKPVVIDVLSDAVKGTGGNIVPGSVELLVTQDANGMVFGTTKTVMGEGVWTVDAAGKVTFTTNAAFKMGNPSPVGFRVSDDSVPPRRSNTALITVQFKDSPTIVDPLPKDAPVAQDHQSLDNVAGTIVTINVLTGATPAGDIDAKSVRIVSGADKGKRLTVVGQGSWIVGDTGTIEFRPEKPTYAGNPNPIMYVLATSDGVVSDSKMITVTYKGALPVGILPVAGNINITTYDFPPTPAGGPIAQTPLPTRITVLDHVMTAPGGAAIDPNSPLFFSTLTPVGTGGNPGAIYTNPVLVGTTTIGFRTITVPGQGIWTIEDSTDTPPKKQIVFTPNALVMGAPTAVTYTVADTNGNRSNPGRIVLYGQIDVLIKAVNDLHDKSDDDFWSDLTRDVVNTTTDIDEFMAVINTLETLVRTRLGADATVVFTNATFPQIGGGALNTLVSEWTTAGLSPQSLFTIAAREVTAAKTLPGAPTLATRAIRLNLMRRMYRSYIATLVQMMGGGGT